MTHPVYREECKKKRGRIPCWWAGTEEREREKRIHVKAEHPPPLPATRKEERGTERRSRLG